VVNITFNKYEFMVDGGLTSGNIINIKIRYNYAPFNQHNF